MPSWPVPPKRSSTFRPSMSNWMMLKRDSFTLSVVGLVSMPWSSLSFRPRAVPVMTRMAVTLLFLYCGSAPAPSQRYWVAVASGTYR